MRDKGKLREILRKIHGKQLISNYHYFSKNFCVFFVLDNIYFLSFFLLFYFHLVTKLFSFFLYESVCGTFSLITTLLSNINIFENAKDNDDGNDADDDDNDKVGKDA